ncbi:MAG TPA: molybdopterin-dependent oxidoreductase, partial [Pseudoxanthomonas sp.]|nr:molybdopterin-dependent oxidoreductase [Pseudoxanthomonas sp.]
PQGANALGLARAGVLPGKRDVAGMFAEPRSAYVLYGIEPGLDFADGAAAQKALNAAKVVAFSHFACQSTRNVADVILPIGALPEIEATLTNLDGADQRTQPAGRLPGEAREGWRVLRALGGELQLPGFDFTDLAGARAVIANQAQASVNRDAASKAPMEGHVDGLELAVSAGIYRTDSVVRRASALQAHPLNVPARIVLNPADAVAMGLAEGKVAKVGGADGTATLPLIVDTRVAAGTAWIESGHGATSPLGAGRVTVVSA